MYQLLTCRYLFSVGSSTWSIYRSVGFMINVGWVLVFGVDYFFDVSRRWIVSIQSRSLFTPTEYGPFGLVFVVLQSCCGCRCWSSVYFVFIQACLNSIPTSLLLRQQQHTTDVCCCGLSFVLLLVVRGSLSTPRSFQAQSVWGPRDGKSPQDRLNKLEQPNPKNRYKNVWRCLIWIK